MNHGGKQGPLACSKLSTTKVAEAIYWTTQVLTYGMLTGLWVIFLLNLIEWFGIIAGAILSLFVPLMFVFPFYHWYRDGHLPWTFLAIFGLTLVLSFVGTLALQRFSDS